MATDPRLQRLKDLVVRVEQMPPSEERDRILREIRARAVDLDTGVKPRAMLPVDAPPPSRRPGQLRHSRPIPVPPETRQPAPARPEVVVAQYRQPVPPTEHARTTLALASPPRSRLARADELLSLEDEAGLWPSADGHGPPDQDVRPWRKGLRG